MLLLSPQRLPCSGSSSKVWQDASSQIELFKRLDASSIKHKRIRGLLMGLTCDKNNIDISKLSKSRWTIGIHLELICWFFRNKSRYIVSIAIHEIRRQNRFSFWTLCILEPMIASEQVVDESILVAFLLHPWLSTLFSRLCQNWRKFLWHACKFNFSNFYTYTLHTLKYAHPKTYTSANLWCTILITAGREILFF